MIFQPVYLDDNVLKFRANRLEYLVIEKLDLRDQVSQGVKLAQIVVTLSRIGVLLVIASVQLEDRLVYEICIIVIREKASENPVAVRHLVVFDDQDPFLETVKNLLHLLSHGNNVLVILDCFISVDS